MSANDGRFSRSFHGLMRKKRGTAARISPCGLHAMCRIARVRTVFPPLCFRHGQPFSPHRARESTATTRYGNAKRRCVCRLANHSFENNLPSLCFRRRQPFSPRRVGNQRRQFDKRTSNSGAATALRTACHIPNCTRKNSSPRPVLLATTALQPAQGNGGSSSIKER